MKILNPLLWLIVPLIFTFIGVKLFGAFSDGSFYPYFFDRLSFKKSNTS